MNITLKYREIYLLFKKKKVKVNKEIISYSIYMNIIRTYFYLWIRDFLYIKEPIYFPLGGKAKKMKYSIQRKNHISKYQSENPIVINWFDRGVKMFQNYAMIIIDKPFRQEKRNFIEMVGDVDLPYYTKKSNTNK